MLCRLSKQAVKADLVAAFAIEGGRPSDGESGKYDVAVLIKTLGGRASADVRRQGEHLGDT